jgi:murein DD-endopeptidase MepM/ murein hydrolase activator NlpD
MLKERTAKIWARLTKKYRLVVYDHESLSQARTVILKPITVVGLIGGGVLLTALLTGLLVSNVPAFRRAVPGLAAASSDEYKLMQQKNMDLERQVAEMDSMLQVFSNAMSAGQTAQPGNGHMYEPLPSDDPSVQDDHGASEVPVSDGHDDHGHDEGGSSTASTPTTPTPAPADPVVTTPTPTVAVQVKSKRLSFLERAEEAVARRRDAAQAATSGQPASTATPGQSPKAGSLPEVFNLIPPVDGYVTTEFSTNDKNHYGMDLVANENSMIKAVASGIVVFSEYSTTTGYVIAIWHADKNLLSFYKHNSRVLREVGSYVYAGEAIAIIGNTGINSSGTHLHFELWHDNLPVNPADYIIFN